MSSHQISSLLSISPRRSFTHSFIDLPPKVTVDVFEGVLQGFFGSGTYPELKHCASDASDAYTDISDAISLIKKWTVDDVIDGLEELGNSMDVLKSALTDCKASEKELADFVAAVEDGFHHPGQVIVHVGEDLIVHGQQIYEEISTAIEDFEGESYRDAGVQIGGALDLLFNGRRL